MIILGLTGSIGMGKSTAAAMFRYLGVPVDDADAAVHALLGPGGAAVKDVEATFPGVVKGGAVDRAELGKRVFGDEAALKRLEGILHPLVGAAREKFLELASIRRDLLVVLDVPLLFETGGERLCDAVAVVSAPPRVQRQRVLARPGMDEKRLASVLARQMPDAEKRRHADFVIPTGLGYAFTLRRIREVVKVAKTLPRRHWPPFA